MRAPNPLRHLTATAALILWFVLSLDSTLAQSPPTRHTVEADGHPLTLWARTVEAPRGHILLHHGRTWSSLPDFDLQVAGEELSLMRGFNEAGYSVWALDARGYGQTPRDASGWLTPDRAAEDLATVLDWLHARTGQTINVWGWSYGSMVAQLTAQRFPQRIRSVTLFGYPTDPDREIAFDDGSGQPERRRNTAEAAASDFIVPDAISQAAIDAFVRAALQADPVRADWNRLHQWNALDGAALDVPTLLLQAEFDPLADTDAHARLFTDIANANRQWVVLAGGAHAALLETPRQRLIKASVDFMEWLDL